MARVSHFEIHASSPESLIAFYRELFGWTFTAWGPPGMYWLITTGPSDEPGINGGLVPRRGAAPLDAQAVSAYVCTSMVTDCQGTLDRAVQLGGVVALPRMPVPGVGWLAYAKDPDGNIFGMMQADTSAK